MKPLNARRKALVAAVLVPVLLVVAASVVAADPLSGHAHSAPTSASRGPGWGRPGPTFAVTFQETGLPSGAAWSVQLFGPASWQSYGNASNTSSIGFALSNGTYQFSASALGNLSDLYGATPAQGTIVVDGAAVSQAVAFAALPVSLLTFSETGLPSGTFWSVSLAGNQSGGGGWGESPVPLCFGETYWNGSTTSTVTFAVPNGSYSFSIGNVTVPGTLYVPSPSNGSVNISGAPVTVDTVFASVPLYNLTFDETGLPGGTPWSVTIFNDSTGWLFNVSANATLNFSVPSGVYNFSVGNVSGPSVLYVPTPANGSVTVDGAAATVDVSFAAVPLYALTFTETGLPTGTFWSVGIWNDSTGGDWNGSTNATVSFEVPNGVYNFTVGPVGGYGGFGPFCPNGTPVPSGVYLPTPASGNATVDGAPVTVAIAFAPETFTSVTFVETGLPSGTFWSVQVFGGSAVPEAGVSPDWGGFPGGNGSTNSTVGFSLTSGTYNYSVLPVFANCTQYVPSPGSGSFSANGTALTIDVHFAPLVLYTVSFVETGLPSGAFWSVQLGGWAFGGGSQGSTGTTINVTVPNGTYPFVIPTVGDGGITTWPGPTPFCANGSEPSGLYAATPGAGNVTVDGADVTVSVTFARITLHTVTFEESGLPAGTYWWVGLGGHYSGSGVWSPPAAPECGSWSNGTPHPRGPANISFVVPNGTYTFSVGNVSVNGTVYVPSPASGSVTVSGANVTVTITFTDPPAGSGAHSASPAARSSDPLMRLGAADWAGVAAATALALVGALLLYRRRGPAGPSVPK